MLPNCLADIIWPSLYVAHYYFASGAIVFGFAAEWIIYRYWIGLTWKLAFIASLLVNGVSAAFGYLLIPYSGFLLGAGSFGFAGWLGAWASVIIMNTGIEFPFLWPFDTEWPFRLLGIAFVANFASVLFAFACSLFMAEPKL